ncbi:von Willebrand factor type A domain-containing protein [Archangium violaceum]|uniref:vWA domain-containing protein n=1 Tax=Archangium violaceum TaxID=83451 RepID=UPI00193C00B7|nr:von Willebrand factor type A domain-containing protein [Archangium violaceum]
MKRFAGLSKLTLITLSVLAVLGAVFIVLGANVRGLFGASAAALSSGEGEEAMGSSRSSMLKRKSLVTFGSNEDDSGAPAGEDRFSTFAVDVDTASYALFRRYVSEGGMPPRESIRPEEWVNYFRYRYPSPEQGDFRVDLEGAPSPFTPGRHLVKVGLQGRTIAKSQRKPTHLVFLVDTSGSMGRPDKLPLAQNAMKLMVDGLNESDTVALVTYAGRVRDVLPPTPASERERLFTSVASGIPD